MDIPVWTIHRKIGMSGGGLFARALLREVGAPISPEVAARLQARHHEAFAATGRRSARCPALSTCCGG